MSRLFSGLFLFASLLFGTVAVAEQAVVETGNFETGNFETGNAEPEYSEDDNLAVEPTLRLPIAHDLAALGETSRRTSVPILLMFSTEDCQYCQRLESEVLGPMRLTGIDPKRLIVRKVRVEADETLRLFSGQQRNAEAYARDQDVSVVPTVALVDEHGNDLVPKIVGYQSPGMYEGYLDEAIKVSQQLLDQR